MRTLEMLEALKEKFEEFFAMKDQLDDLKEDLDALGSSLYDMTTNIEETSYTVGQMIDELEELED